jgi:polysaccharide biosynthesis protein VpsI
MALFSRKTINLTVATELNGNGGIASVLNVMSENGFFKRWNIVLLASHTENKRYFNLIRLFLFSKTLLMLIYYHLFYKVNLVHVHMASRWSFLRKSYVIKLTKLMGGHVVLHLHGAGFINFYQNECNEERQKNIRKVFNLSDKVIVLSIQSLIWVKGFLTHPEKAELVYNAVSVVDLGKDETDPNLILFLGRIGQRKGVGDLIDAFATIVAEFPQARLALGGDGDAGVYQKQVQRLKLEDRVLFLGWIAGQDKLDWLKRAGIYALPSYYEAFPMGVLEAMAADIPVLASTAGGIPEAITHEKEGLLVEAGNIEEISTALRTLLASKEKRELYAKRAREKYMKNFSPQVVLPKLDDIYSGFL